MFKNVLIPISSEFYNKEVLRRGVSFFDKFKSNITLIYIIEEKTLNQTDKLTDTYRTPYEKEETKNDIVSTQKQTADNIIFDDARYYFKNKKISFEEKIIKGEFSRVVLNEVKKKDYNLILMGFEKECILNYRLFEDIDISIWVESGNISNSILAVCSNLAPNMIVPEMSANLSKLLGWNLQMIYIVDVEDSVQVDENGQRSTKKPERDLLFSGQQFIDEMKKKKIDVELVKGSFEKETIKAAENINPNLIVIGREQKKKGMLGLPVKNLRKKLAEKCHYSILFIH